MSTCKEQWQEVQRIGLIHDSYTNGDELPGVMSVYCFRSPSSDLNDTPYVVEVENLDKGTFVKVHVNRHTLFVMAHSLMEAALRAHPNGVDPDEYFADQVEGGDTPQW